MTNYMNDTLTYQKIKELDLESEKKLTEGSGPADECICHILAPPEQGGGGGRGLKDSIKRAFRNMSGSMKHPMGGGGGRYGGGRERGGSCVNPDCAGSVGTGGGVLIPFTTEKGGKGIYTTKETLKRTKPCGSKCGCDKENIVMKHAYANIKIISPDVSSICPCPNSCLNTEALNNIKVTVKRFELHPDTSDSEASVSSVPPKLPEPVIEKRPISELIESQYDDGTMLDDDVSMKEPDKEEDDVSEWSFGIMVGEESQEEESEEEKPVSASEADPSPNEASGPLKATLTP